MDKDWTPPNPSRFGAALAKGQGLHPRPTLHDLEWPKMDKDWTPPTLHDLERLPHGQGLDLPTLHDLERPPNWTRMGSPQPLKVAAPAEDVEAPAIGCLESLELNPKMLELRVVLGWAVCYAPMTSPHLKP